MLREKGFVGYAEYYLRQCLNESELTNKADKAVYKQLLEMDSTQLGITQSHQLSKCLLYSPQKDLIEVRINFLLLEI